MVCLTSPYSWVYVKDVRIQMVVTNGGERLSVLRSSSGIAETSFDDSPRCQQGSCAVLEGLQSVIHLL